MMKFSKVTGEMGLGKSTFWGKEFILFAIVLLVTLTMSCSEKPKLPGEYSWGTLLPNHWILTPAGEQVAVGDLPLNMILSPDGKMLAVTNNGYSKQFVSLIDVGSRKTVQELPMNKAFFGISFSPDGQKLYASAGGDDRIAVWRKEKGKFVKEAPIMLEGPESRIERFPVGLAVSPDGRRLFVAENRVHQLAIVDLQKQAVEKRIPIPNYPYDLSLLNSGEKLYVSQWGGSVVTVVDVFRQTVTKSIPVGDHPNKMVMSPDRKRLFVACANTDEIKVIDTAADKVIETIGLHPYPDAPFGSTPNGLAVSPDGGTLFVANAANNDVAVIDVSRAGRSRVQGLIPAGWYPTAVSVSKDGGLLFVANGKGLRSKPNPNGPNPYKRRTRKTEYIGGLFNGTVSILAVPGKSQLREFTAQVEKNNGFNEAARRIAEKPETQTAHALPRRPGEPSLIKHVVYIIKENRTYDQVLGDHPRGNGDPNLCLFGKNVTPNQHALADQFVLLDNFYVDAEVSADGHEWSTGAIATDFVEKVWPTNYSSRGYFYPSEGRDAIAFPTNGYIWEAAAARGLSYRSYAEFIHPRGDSLAAGQSGLKGHFCPDFRPWDLSYPDTLRAQAFIRELKRFEKQDNFPNFVIMRLPNNHTAGTKPGMPTPKAMVAENDLALGRVVEAISHSKFWKETVIFVIEDDAQNGPDHVDAHRTIAFVAGPYIKRQSVDHTMYDTVSMLRTMELILGLSPLSQYDAAAFPMVNCFSDQPDTTPYSALRPKVSMSERNTRTAYGAQESMAMNFKVEDATPEIRLNEIIWKSVKGVDSEMPRPISHRKRVDLD